METQGIRMVALRAQIEQKRLWVNNWVSGKAVG